MTKITGCNPPCSYRKFTEVGERLLVRREKFGKRKYYVPHLILFKKGYKILLANNEVQVEEEHLIYDFISFVSECGGSLGLFLGFSFFMVFDYFTPLLLTLRKTFGS